jgi:hypothetical protein
MTTTASAFFGEKYLTKVAAVFDDGEQARAAAERVGREAGIASDQIRVLRPDDPAMSRKLEPETRGIARTLARSHITLGIAGLLIGLVAAFVLVALDITLFAGSPLYTVLVFGFFGAIAGLLLGGLVSMRPDHDRLIAWVRASAREGQWFVVVHVRDHGQEGRVKDALKALSGKVVTTF